MRRKTPRRAARSLGRPSRKALRVGRQLHGPRAVTFFDDLGVFRLLSLIEDTDELDRFVQETLRLEQSESRYRRATTDLELDSDAEWPSIPFDRTPQTERRPLIFVTGSSWP